MGISRRLALIAVAPLLGGCNMVLLQPAGDVALQQRNIMYASTALMLLVVIPVLAATIWMAWRYRASAKADYAPEWSHSLSLEVVIWAVPLLIIVAIGAITWMGTHLLDPYRPIAKTPSDNPVVAAQAISAAASQPGGIRPLVIQVVALDWKWLFIYPDSGVASVNEVVAPVFQPVEFKITSSSVMNSFFIPSLAGQIYAMPGMQTRLHAVTGRAGDYEGFSANYSGAGFSNMRFRFRAVQRVDYDAWIAAARSGGATLGRTDYLALEKPSERERVRLFRDVPGNLFDLILNQCVDPSKMCMKDTMAIDMQGGGGREGLSFVFSHGIDDAVRRGRQPLPPRPFVAALCSPEDSFGQRLASLPN